MFPVNYVDTKTTWDAWAKKHPEIVNKKRKIILRQGQSPGDILTFTRALGDLKESYPNYEIDVRTPCPEIWENSPRLTPLKDDDKDVETFNITYDEINESGWSAIHFTDSFRHDLEKKLGVPIRKTGIKPEIWFSDEEKNWYNQVHCEFGWDGPYWIINAGRKPDNELKQYHNWTDVVKSLNKYFKGKVKIVQIGHPDHIHPPLEGALNLVGKTDLRQLLRLIYSAHGSIGPLSFQFVASGAFEQPSVCVAGGKEGVKWHLYPHMRYIHTNGALPCCSWDGCWLGGEKGQCKNLIDGVPKCFRIIKPETIADAVKMYYEGGMRKLPTDEEYEGFIKFQKDYERTSKK